MPNYTRYGNVNGFICLAVGHPNFFARTMKIAKDWCASHGFDYIRL